MDIVKELFDKCRQKNVPSHSKLIHSSCLSLLLLLALSDIREDKFCNGWKWQSSRLDSLSNFECLCDGKYLYFSRLAHAKTSTPIDYLFQIFPDHLPPSKSSVHRFFSRTTTTSPIPSNSPKPMVGPLGDYHILSDTMSALPEE